MTKSEQVAKLLEQTRLIEAYEWLLDNASPNKEYKDTYIDLIDQCMVEKEWIRMFEVQS